MLSIGVSTDFVTPWASALRAVKATPVAIADWRNVLRLCGMRPFYPLWRRRSCRRWLFSAALPLVRIFEIRVTVQPVFVKAQQASGLLVAEPSFANRRLHALAQSREQIIRLELHVIQYLANRIALDHFVQNRFARFAQPDVYRVGVPEKIVQIAQNLLISAHKKCADVIILA